MVDKIDIRVIIVDHVRTLRVYGTEEYPLGDFALFFGLPLIAAFILTYFRPALTSDLAAVLSTSLSVFAALLFNLLLLIYDMLTRTREAGERAILRTKLVQEIYSNVSFCILLSILALIFLLADFLRIKRYGTERAIAFVVYYLVGVFVMTLLMVLKRTHVLLRREVQEDTQPPSSKR